MVFYKEIMFVTKMVIRRCKKNGDSLQPTLANAEYKPYME
jgi:hypothetical protein